MYIYKKEDLEIFIKNTTKKALEIKNFDQAMKYALKTTTDYYTDTQMSFAEKRGKRISFISGYGKESFKPVEINTLVDKYVLLLQNIDNVNKDEKEKVVNMFKLIVQNR
ncbi:MAG: hypothetical protein WCR27_01835 [Eubacteriales bacterium]